MNDEILQNILDLLNKNNHHIIIYKNNELIYPKNSKWAHLINNNIIYDKDNKKFYKVMKNEKNNYKIYFLEDISLQKYYEMKSIYDPDTYLYSKYGILKKLENLIPESCYISLALYEINYDNLILINQKLRKLINNSTYIGRYDFNKFLIIFKDQKNIDKKIEYINNNIKNIVNFGIYKINLNAYDDKPFILKKYIIYKLIDNFKKN